MVYIRLIFYAYDMVMIYASSYRNLMAITHCAWGQRAELTASVSTAGRKRDPHEGCACC